MTPVASWTPADYHRAFNQCRAAWERTSPQLTIDGWADMVDGLEEREVGDGHAWGNRAGGAIPPVERPGPSPRKQEPAASRSSSPDPVAGLDEPHTGVVRRVEPATPQAPLPGGGLATTTTAPAAEPRTGLRGRGQKGA